MILYFAIAKIIMMTLPALYIFYYGDKGKWDDPGCKLWGGPDMVYKD